VAQLINALVLGAIYCLFAIGLTLTWGMLNVLNLAHGSVFMFSVFSCYVLTVKWGLPIPWPALIVVCIVVGALLELLLDQVVFRIIRRRTTDHIMAERSMLIATIGAGAIPIAIAQPQLLSTEVFSLNGGTIDLGGFTVGSVRITTMQVVIFVSAVTLTVVLALYVQRSREGRAIRALAADSWTAQLMGINHGRLSSWALIVSGGTAGMAGGFLAIYLTGMSPETGNNLLLKAFAAIVVGGVGSIWGTLVGAYVLASTETFITATTSGTWVDAMSFGIIMVVLLIRPNGLFGRRAIDRT
jgi:branched-chain amino acid transport system permease protein